MDVIEVTQEILDMDLDARSECRCYLYEALSDFYNIDKDSDIGIISVGMYAIKLSYPYEDKFTCSKKLTEWQHTAIEYQDSKEYPNHNSDANPPLPITIIVDYELEMIYIDGEFDE